MPDVLAWLGGSDRVRVPQPPGWARPEDRAAVMFTAGSLGQPDVVISPHRAVVAAHTATTYLDVRAHQVFLRCSRADPGAGNSG
jgi:hypothetical protein